MSDTPARQTAAHVERMQVRYRDTDAQGHLYFANYMVFADEAAGAFLAALGFDWSNPAQMPCLVFTANISCDFLHECRFGDTVRIEVGYGRLGTASARMDFALFNDACGTALARGSIAQVFVDHETRKSTPIPTPVRAAIAARQPELGLA